MKQVDETKSIRQIEEKIAAGMVEELIVQAHNELKLIRLMKNWEPWDHIIGENAEDKETLVEALNLAHDTIDVMQGVMETLTIKEERLKELASENFATATELANYLVREHDIPFRLCHRIVGYVVGELVLEGKNFNDKERTKELLAEKEIYISDEAYDLFV